MAYNQGRHVFLDLRTYARSTSRSTMDLAEAIRQNVPLQLCLPVPSKPLDDGFRCLAEVFLLETTVGAAVAWLEPYWPAERDARVSRICYANPVEKKTLRWIDNDPKFGPFCIAYQKPFLVERLTQQSPLWKEYLDWQAWRHARRSDCLRSKAWKRVELDLASIQPRRLV